MSTKAIPVHVALVDETGGLPELSNIAAALNEQIQADFAPSWHVAASVGAYFRADVPEGCWTVTVQGELDDPNALGYHSDQNQQPFAVVKLTTPEQTGVTIGHEVLEMLADPFGNRLHSAILPDLVQPSYKAFGLEHTHSRIRYLVEVCDPCEATSYEVGGIRLSDFLNPLWYRTKPVVSSGSYAGGCITAREVAPGGYVSFEGADDNWYQVFNEDGGVSVQQLGKFNRNSFSSLREFTDYYARDYRAKAKP